MEVSRRLSVQANFLNSLKCNHNVETLNSTNSSQDDKFEDLDILEDKLISEEREQENSPLQESTYNNFLPDLLKIKKKLKSDLKNKISIDQYKKKNAMREYKLKSEYKTLETSLQKKSTEKTNLVAEVCKLQESLREAEYSFSTPKNEKEPLSYKLSVKKGKQSSILNLHLYKRNTIIDVDENFNNFINHHQNALKKVQFNYEKNKLIENLNSQKLEKKTLLQKLEVELKKIKTDVKVIKNKLLRHYYDVLKVGLDTRKEGLTWVIKEICLLKGIVKATDMPEFLDLEAISYLYNITKKKLDLDKILEEKHTMKSEVQIKKNNGDIRINPMIKLFNTPLNNDLDLIKTQNSQSTQSHSSNSSAINSYSDKSSISANSTPLRKNTLTSSQTAKLNFNIRHVSQFFDNKIKLTEDTQKIIQSISNLDKKESSIREEIKNLKEKEMKRICLEFIKNNYERRFFCDKKTVVAALIGEEDAQLELVRQFSQQKEYYKDIERCRNFLPYLLK